MKNVFWPSTDANRSIPYRYASLYRPILICIDSFQRWTGTHFIPVSLRDLGAIFHLGHIHGSPCVVPSTPVPLTVFDVTGVHIVNTTYCECSMAGPAVPPRVQLLRNRWFPATWHRPGTAFTFRFLNFLHKLQSTSKVNLYDFHNAMTSVFDGSGLSKPLVRTNFSRAQTPMTHSLCSLGTVSYHSSFAYLYTYANSGAVGAPTSWVGSLLFRRGAWLSSVLRAPTPAGTLSRR